MRIGRALSAEKKMLPVILALAWPTMLEELLQTAVQYLDVAMVGSLGKEATAAAGATTTVNWMIGSTIYALGIGFLSYIAKAIGEGDERKAARSASQVVLAVLLVGGLFTVLTLSLSSVVPILMQVEPSVRGLAGRYFFILYTPMLFRTASILFGTVLRAAGDTRTPMRVGLIVNAVNVILNFFLIFPTRNLILPFGHWYVTIPGAGWGVIGAAAASAVSFTVGGLLMTAAFWRHPFLSPRGQSLKPDKDVLKPCLKVAVPNMLQRLGTSFGYVVFAALINALGEASTAAHTIANTIESAFYIPGYGMQTAAATLTGNIIGEGDRGKQKVMTSAILKLEITLMVLSGALLFAFAPRLMTVFSSDAEVCAAGATVLRMVAVSEPFYGVSIVIEGILFGAGETVKPFLFNMIGMWSVRILGTLICTCFLGFGLISAWACMILHNLLLFAMYVVYFRRGTWNQIPAAGESS